MLGLILAEALERPIFDVLILYNHSVENPRKADIRLSHLARSSARNTVLLEAPSNSPFASFRRDDSEVKAGADKCAH